MKKLLALAVVLSWFGTASAQERTITDPGGKLTLQIKLEATDPFDPAFKQGAKNAPLKIIRGQPYRLTIQGEIKPGFHTYPFSKLAPKQDVEFLSTIKYKLPPEVRVLWPGAESEPHPKLGPEGPTLEHELVFTWSQDLIALPDAKPGTHPLEMTMRFQVCDDRGCVVSKLTANLDLNISSDTPVAMSTELTKRLDEKMPELQRSAGWSVDHAGSSTSVAKQPVEKPAPPSRSDRSDGISGSEEEYRAYLFDRLLPNLVHEGQTKDVGTGSEGGLWLFILMGMAWGGISLITPCVFPMIPITVSYFLKQSEKEHHKPLTMAAVYSGTIILVLTLAAALFINFFRALSIHPLMNYAIGALFIYFALSLFGMYEIELPSGLARFTSAKEGQGGYLGVVFMALTFTIISFACVAPFLGGFAGTAAGERPLWQTLLGGLAFSVTFAAPFFILALFPTMLRKLPKSGSWLNTVKVVMGFLEVAAALKFFRSAELLSTSQPSFFTFDLVLGLYVTLSILCGLYLLNVYRLPHDSPLEYLSVPRLLFAIFFFTMAFYLSPGLFKFNSDGDTQRPRGTIFAWVESFLLPESKATSKSGDLQYAIESARDYRQKTGQPKRIFLDCTGFS